MTFEDYARRRLRALLRTATAITGDPHLAEEIVQDVLVKLARHWQRIEAGTTGRDAYVRRMIVNEYISWRRKWSRQIPTQDLDPGPSAEHDHAERSAERDALVRELAKLPRRQQVVLALRYFEGLPDADIAAALGCTESTVRAHSSRGLAALRVEMAPQPVTGNQGGTR